MRCVAQFGIIWTIKKKSEKDLWKSVTFNKVAGENPGYLNSSMSVFHIFKIVQMIPNRPNINNGIPRFIKTYV